MTNHIVQNGKLGVQPPPMVNSVERFKRLIHSEPALTCPFLGLKDDPETLTNYASEENHCHCKVRPHPINLDFQQMHCLFDYTTCKLFLKRMAAEVKASEKSEQKGNRHPAKPKVGMVTTLSNLLGIK